MICTGYHSKIMMLKVQRTKLQRQIEENSENGKEVIEKSILEHADLRGLERELHSSQKEMERIEENIRSASERVEKEEEKMMHLADRVKREVNQACVQVYCDRERVDECENGGRTFTCETYGSFEYHRGLL